RVAITGSSQLAGADQRPTACSSWALLIEERPLTFLRRASWYSCSFVRPAEPERERCPPRRDDEMSLVDVRLACRDSPARARSLFTVHAAISSARPSGRPWARMLFLMSSYWRSRLAVQDCCGIARSFRRSEDSRQARRANAASYLRLRRRRVFRPTSST